jgi:hypothetical protein
MRGVRQRFAWRKSRLHLVPSPLTGADRGRYVMHVTFAPLPSPLIGKGAGGGEDATSSPHPNLPPPGGEGVLTYPCQHLGGAEKRVRSWGLTKKEDKARQL